MRLLYDASVLYRFVERRNVFAFGIPTCDFGHFLAALDPLGYSNGLLNTGKISFTVNVFEIDEELLSPYGRLVAIDRNAKSTKEVSFEACLFYFMLEFKRDLSRGDTRLTRLLTALTPPTPDTFADDVSELRDNYKLYTVLYRNGDVKVDDFLNLLTNGILRKCAEVLEFVLDNRVYSNINMLSARYLLNLFLYTVHTTHPMLKKQKFQFDLSYVNLYCHCIRHNRVTSYDENSYVIENDYAGKTLTVIVPKKLFVKLCVSLVNIVAHLHAHAAGSNPPLYLPREVIALLRVSPTIERKFVRVGNGKVEDITEAEYTTS
jgi:hypothetical protein